MPAVAKKEKALAYKEKIDRAASVDIVSYLDSVGEKIMDNGRGYYSLERHDSLVINSKTNTYTWYSLDEGTKFKNGNVINLLQVLYGKDFKEAVRELNGDNFRRMDPKEREVSAEKAKNRGPFQYKKHIEMKDKEAIRKYLVEERYLDSEIVNMLIEKKLVRQSLEKDVIFLWNKDGKIAGADIQGTVKDLEKYKKRGTKKRVLGGSEEFYGFNITLGDPKAMYCFESPIDLLSFWSLNKYHLENARLVSMSGAKPKAVEKFYYHTLNTRNPNLKKVYLCTDNDKVGHGIVNYFNENNQHYNAKVEQVEFINRIPNDLAISTENKAIYESIGEKYGLDWKWLAAFHKTENNAHAVNEATNSQHVHLYYSKELSTTEKKTAINVEQCTKALAKDLSSYLEDKQVFIPGEFLFEKTGKTLLDFEDTLLNYYQQYEMENYMILDAIPKDWNDMLKLQYKEQRLLEKEKTQEAEAFFVQI
ncbi:TPA: toprim domain-containing protein [Listeria monocytogenes]|nr:toprim domain-containing protein [Listeria monocytogenes]